MKRVVKMKMWHYLGCVCLLTMMLTLTKQQSVLDDLDCTDDDVNALFTCVLSLTLSLSTDCAVECSVLQAFVDCANEADVSEGCINSLDDAINLLADTTDCDRTALDSLIDTCFPGGLMSVVIMPVLAEKEPGSCSASCGAGTQSWTRKCVSDRDPTVERNGCSGERTGTQDCYTNCTQPDGVLWTDWSEYSDCSVTCGEGLKARQRHCVSEYNTTVTEEGCVGPDTETEACTMRKCKTSGSTFVQSGVLLPILILFGTSFSTETNRT